MPPAFDTSTTTSLQWEKANSGNSMPSVRQISDITTASENGIRHFAQAVAKAALNVNVGVGFEFPMVAGKASTNIQKFFGSFFQKRTLS
jgi:hypothetical protein